MSGDHEQRVVDADADDHQISQLRGEVGHGHDVGEQGEQRRCPLPSAAAALSSGSAVAPSVRKTRIRMMNAAMKPSNCGDTPPVLGVDPGEHVAGELDLQLVRAQRLQVLVDGGRRAMLMTSLGERDLDDGDGLGGVEQAGVAGGGAGGAVRRR